MGSTWRRENSTSSKMKIFSGLLLFRTPQNSWKEFRIQQAELKSQSISFHQREFYIFRCTFLKSEPLERISQKFERRDDENGSVIKGLWKKKKRWSKLKRETFKHKTMLSMKQIKQSTETRSVGSLRNFQFFCVSKSWLNFLLRFLDGYSSTFHFFFQG